MTKPNLRQLTLLIDNTCLRNLKFWIQNCVLTILDLVLHRASAGAQSSCTYIGDLTFISSVQPRTLWQDCPTKKKKKEGRKKEGKNVKKISSIVFSRKFRGATVGDNRHYEQNCLNLYRSSTAISAELYLARQRSRLDVGRDIYCFYTVSHNCGAWQLHNNLAIAFWVIKYWRNIKLCLS